MRECAWLAALNGFGFVTGAMMVNFTYLAPARHIVLNQAEEDVEADGMFCAPEVAVVVGEEVHHTLVSCGHFSHTTSCLSALSCSILQGSVLRNCRVFSSTPSCLCIVQLWLSTICSSRRGRASGSQEVKLFCQVA